MDSPVNFFVEEIDFEVVEPEDLSFWVKMIAEKYGFSIRQLDYIFCSDLYLLKLNRDYLGHEDYTDILTFPYEDAKKKEIFGDIYISIERVKENAENLNQTFIDELHRVMIHGLLHMVGFDDHDVHDRIEMRKAEDLALSLRMF